MAVYYYYYYESAYVFCHKLRSGTFVDLFSPFPLHRSVSFFFPFLNMNSFNHTTVMQTIPAWEAIQVIGLQKVSSGGFSALFGASEKMSCLYVCAC